MNSTQKPVAVVIGATSKWQADGRNTRLVHGRDLDDSNLPVGIRWGIGGAVAQKFAQEGFFVVLTTRFRRDGASRADELFHRQQCRSGVRLWSGLHRRGEWWRAPAREAAKKYFAKNMMPPPTTTPVTRSA